MQSAFGESSKNLDATVEANFVGSHVAGGGREGERARGEGGGVDSMRFSLMILTELLNWSAPERTSGGASLSVDIAKLHFG